MRVLIVEDERRVAEGIAEAAVANGFVAEIAPDGEDAWFRGGTEPYAAIVLDLGLPKIDGITVLKRWRSEGVTTPVIVLTARGSWSERVDGIDARLRALVRRAGGRADPVIEAGQLRLDPRIRQVTANGIPVQLTPLEYRLLHYLLHQRGRVVSQGELSENLYTHDSERASNAIEALVGRLRRKLKVDLIETRRGFGYIVS
jgi:two-component system, OmpR family, response regulator